MGEPVRLQKILAAAGFGSRRGCETFITEGRVSVDGAVIMELGAKADVESQSVELDGRKIAGPGKLSKAMRDADERVYYALNKPKGALCTNEDPAGRPVAVNMIPEKRRIFCVGRLDLDTEGLIILTNDGDLTNRLTHPRYGVPKTYLARVEGEFGAVQMRKLQVGMHLAEGRTQGAKVRVRRKEGRHCVLEITISEGMNRQVRRMLARIELKCRSLKRIAIGPIKLGEMNPGEFRKLTADELVRLNAAIATAEAEGKAGQKAEGRGQETGGRGQETEDREQRTEGREKKTEGRQESEERGSSWKVIKGGKKAGRADKHAFDRSKDEEVVEEFDEEIEEDDDGEDAFAAARSIASKSDSATKSKRRVIDDDDDVEIEVADTAEDDADLEEDEALSPEEEAEIEALNAKLAENASDDEEDSAEAEKAEALDDEKSTEAAVEAMDEVRPWEKVASKTGKAWADRGDTVHDPELVAIAAEEARAQERMGKEQTAAQNESRDPRDRAGRGERPKFEKSGPRPDRSERAPRGRDGRPDERRSAGTGGGKPWEKRGQGRGFDAKKSFDGERKPREYGERAAHTPRPWEKTADKGRGGSYSKPDGYAPRGGGSDRPRPYSKPGGYDRGAGGGEKPRSYSKPGGYAPRAGGSDRPRPYSKPGGYDRGAGGGEKPRSYSKPGGYAPRAGGSDRPRPYSKPGGYDRGAGGGEKPRSYSKPGGYDRGSGGGEKPRSYSKPGVYAPRAGGSDRPRPYSKPGGFDRSSGAGRGERKPWVKREGSGGSRGGPRGDDRRDQRPAKTDGGSRSRPWENAKPGGERGEERGGQSTRPWEKKRE